MLLGPDLKEELPGPVPPGAPRRGRARRARSSTSRARDHGLTPLRHHDAAPRCPATPSATRSAAGHRRRSRARSRIVTVRSSSCSAARRSRSRPTRPCTPRRCSPRVPNVTVPLRAAARQRARRARPRAHARLPARARHPRQRAASTSAAHGAACPTRRASTPPASSPRRPTAAITRARAARVRPARRLPRPRARRARRSSRSTASSCVGAFPDDGARTRRRRAAADGVGRAGRHRARTSRAASQRLGRKITPEGTAMEAWRIAAELAARLGVDFDLETAAEVQDEIARVAPAFAGVDARCCGARATASCCRSPSTTTRSSSARRRPAPACRGSRSGPGRRKSGPRSGAEAAEADGAGGGPVAAGPAARWDAQAHGPRGCTGRRVQSAPRGGAHALRHPTRCAPRRRPSRRSPTSPRCLMVSPRDRDRIGVADGDRVRVTSARGSIELVVARRPGQHRSASRSSRRTAPARVRPTLIDADGTGHRPARGDTFVIPLLRRRPAPVRRHRPDRRAHRHRQDDRRCSRCC